MSEIKNLGLTCNQLTYLPFKGLTQFCIDMTEFVLGWVEWWVQVFPLWWAGVGRLGQSGGGLGWVGSHGQLCLTTVMLE